MSWWVLLREHLLTGLPAPSDCWGMPHLIQVIAACVSITIFVPLAMIFTMAGKVVE